jgi:biopolymer transport protein ExbD
MITRPLDLASRLRSEPRNLDSLFYVNVVLLVVFFALFGSKFVLAPGLGVDFRLPVVEGANTHARPTTHFISVASSGLILTSDGYLTLAELGTWLAKQASQVKEPILLVRGDAEVRATMIGGVTTAAKSAGFVEVLWAFTEPANQGENKGR